MIFYLTLSTDQHLTWSDLYPLLPHCLPFVPLNHSSSATLTSSVFPPTLQGWPCFRAFAPPFCFPEGLLPEHIPDSFAHLPPISVHAFFLRELCSLTLYETALLTLYEANNIGFTVHVPFPTLFFFSCTTPWLMIYSFHYFCLFPLECGKNNA